MGCCQGNSVWPGRMDLLCCSPNNSSTLTYTPCFSFSLFSYHFQSLSPVIHGLRVCFKTLSSILFLSTSTSPMARMTSGFNIPFLTVSGVSESKRDLEWLGTEILILSAKAITKTPKGREDQPKELNWIRLAWSCRYAGVSVRFWRSCWLNQAGDGTDRDDMEDNLSSSWIRKEPPSEKAQDKSQLMGLWYIMTSQLLRRWWVQKEDKESGKVGEINHA